MLIFMGMCPHILKNFTLKQNYLYSFFTRRIWNGINGSNVFGLPVIAFNNSAIPLTVKHGYNGLLAENKNPQQLYELIKLASDNPDLRTKMSKGALQTYENCRTKKDFENDVNLFINESLLKK